MHECAPASYARLRGMRAQAHQKAVDERCEASDRILSKRTAANVAEFEAAFGAHIKLVGEQSAAGAAQAKALG